MCSPWSRASRGLGWGGQLGCERHSLQSWELSLEHWQPKHFTHQGTVSYLFSFFLSPTHSVQKRPVGSQWDWEGKTPLQSQSAVVRWKSWVFPSYAPKKSREQVRVAAQSPPMGHEGAVRWCSMPGIPPPWCRTSPGDRGQEEVAQCCETQEEKSHITVINESKSALCKGAGSRGNLSVR